MNVIHIARSLVIDKLTRSRKYPLMLLHMIVIVEQLSRNRKELV